MTEPKKSTAPDVYTTIIVVAFVCGAATFGMGIVAYNIFSRFSTISDFMTFCIAAMVAPPALMGVGISNFIYKTNLAQLQYGGGKKAVPDGMD